MGDMFGHQGNANQNSNESHLGPVVKLASRTQTTEGHQDPVTWE